MISRLETSFGLVLAAALGALGAMFALGMLPDRQAHADHLTPGAPHVVSMTPSSLDVNAKASWTVTLGVSGAGLDPGSGSISVTFPDGVVLPPSLEKSRVAVGSDVAGNGVFAVFPLTVDPAVSGQTVNMLVPATKPGFVSITGSDRILDGDQVRVDFNAQAGIANPAKSGAAGSISAGTAGKVSTSVQTVSGNIPAPLSFTRTISLGGLTAQGEGGTVTVTLGGFTPELTVSLSGAVSGSAIVGGDGRAVIAGTKTGTTGTVTATDTSGGTATSGVIQVAPSLSVTGTVEVPAVAVTGPETVFADVIANDGNLVRVWRFDNASQNWEFYDPRPAFDPANTLTEVPAGEIIWVNVTAEQSFQGETLFPGWNLISLN